MLKELFDVLKAHYERSSSLGFVVKYDKNTDMIFVYQFNDRMIGNYELIRTICYTGNKNCVIRSLLGASSKHATIQELSDQYGLN